MIATSPERASGLAADEPAETELTETEATEIEERLRDLGYIE